MNNVQVLVLHAMPKGANTASTRVTMKVQDIVKMVVITSQMKRGMSVEAMNNLALDTPPIRGGEQLIGIAKYCAGTELQYCNSISLQFLAIPSIAILCLPILKYCNSAIDPMTPLAVLIFKYLSTIDRTIAQFFR